MKLKYYLIPLVALAAACGKDSSVPAAPGDEIRFEIGLGRTRATEEGFEAGDRISLWAVEQPGEEAVPLQIGGNFLNNEALTFDGSAWHAAQTLYWSDLPCDFYGLYPYQDGITSVTDQPFAVAADQDGPGYQASDLLYAVAGGVTRETGIVQLQFRHLLSKCVVQVVKGEKFEGEIPDDIAVHLYNTTTSGHVDLTGGSVEKDAFGHKDTITACKRSNERFEAIVVPQFIEKRTPLVEITMGGIAYLLEYSISFRPGYVHTIRLTVNTSPDQEKIEIGIDAGQEGWN